MSALVLTDCFIEIDGDPFSGKATNAAIAYSAAAVDITAMGDETKINTGGMKEWSMAFEFNADEATTGNFFSKVGTVVPVEVRASSGARSLSNPAYVGMGLVTEYTPLKGAVGDKHSVSLSLVSAGDLERLTSVTP
jgi:hypothetical protein